MVRIFAILTFLLAMPAATADRRYLVALEDIRQWPATVQQAYVLGVMDQLLFDAYRYEPETHDRVARCVENVKLEDLLDSVMEHVIKEQSDESLTLLIGEGIYEFCKKSGYSLG